MLPNVKKPQPIFLGSFSSKARSTCAMSASMIVPDPLLHFIACKALKRDRYRTFTSKLLAGFVSQQMFIVCFATWLNPKSVSNMCAKVPLCCTNPLEFIPQQSGHFNCITRMTLPIMNFNTSPCCRLLFSSQEPPSVLFYLVLCAEVCYGKWSPINLCWMLWDWNNSKPQHTWALSR